MSNKNILLTGISRGLGLEIAKVLLKEGFTVYGVSRKTSAELQTLSSQYSQSLKVVHTDLSEPEKARHIVFDDFLNLDIPVSAFINNAAMAYDDIITNLRIDPLENMYRVNVFTPMLFTKYAIRNMLLHNIQGSIVHISSISVHTGYKGLAMYASSKGALEAFSRNTAREWGERGIRSNCIVAGFMETEMSSALTAEQKQRIYKRTALKKATAVSSVAETARYLVSDSAASITGQNIFVDSGTI